MKTYRITYVTTKGKSFEDFIDGLSMQDAKRILHAKCSEVKKIESICPIKIVSARSYSK